MNRLISCLIILLALNIPAYAEENPSKFPPLSWEPNIVTQLAKYTREKILPQAKLPNGSIVGPESNKEKQKPIIPPEFEQTIVDHAVFWNTVQWCGLSLKNANFEFLQDSNKWNRKQLAFIASLHGAATSLVKEQLQKKKACSEDFRNYLKKNYPETND